jgi:hypothetical protein
MPSPPYIQLYANKYHCIECGNKQDYLICKLCNYELSKRFTKIIKGVDLQKYNFQSKFKNVVVFGGLNGLGKIIADEIVEVGEKKINLVRTGRNGGKHFNTYSFDLEKYSNRYQNTKNDKSNTENQTKLMDPELLDKIIKADLIIFNAYQTLENDQSIWNTKLSTFNPELAEKRFKINCWGYIGLLNEILEERKIFISNRNIDKNLTIQDQLFVWIDANETRFEGKLSDGKHLELNMAKTACKQIFYTNANIMGGMGILFLCWDCNWCSFHGISVDKIASKSKYLVNPKLSSQALISYISELNFETLYHNKQFIHDMSFYKYVEITKKYKSDLTSEEINLFINSDVKNIVNDELTKLINKFRLNNEYDLVFKKDKFDLL